MSNIDGDRVWFYRSHFGIYALLLWGEAGQQNTHIVLFAALAVKVRKQKESVKRSTLQLLYYYHTYRMCG